ncbi:hypothetical protein ACLB2K_047266 [Fragaria x ananassa]
MELCCIRDYIGGEIRGHQGDCRLEVRMLSVVRWTVSQAVVRVVVQRAGQNWWFDRLARRRVCKARSSVSDPDLEGCFGGWIRATGVRWPANTVWVSLAHGDWPQNLMARVWVLVPREILC